MSLSSALGAVLLLGLPLLLLALGVLAHAYYVARPRSAAEADRLIEELVAESLDQLLAELRAAAAPPAPSSPAMPERAPSGFGGAVSAAAPHGFSALPPTPSPAPPAPPLNLRLAVSQLLAEGLSDRSIARRLAVGIEEVRAARMHASSRRAG